METWSRLPRRCNRSNNASNLHLRSATDVIVPSPKSFIAWSSFNVAFAACCYKRNKGEQNGKAMLESGVHGKNGAAKGEENLNHHDRRDTQI